MIKKEEQRPKRELKGPKEKKEKEKKTQKRALGPKIGRAIA